MTSLSKLTIKDLQEITGGLSNPSKMPGFSYGTPADDCIVGSLLRKVEGSTCSNCYAKKGKYVFPVVRAAQNRRLWALLHDERWEDAMTALIAKKYRNKRKKKDRVFRWHDSGDLQSVDHLDMIVNIAERLKSIQFWLPTRENVIVNNWLAKGRKIPSNLNIRISATMVGQKTEVEGFTTSAVDVHDDGVYQCPASKQNNECGDCRACWSEKVKTVSYKKH